MLPPGDVGLELNAPIRVEVERLLPCAGELVRGEVEGFAECGVDEGLKHGGHVEQQGVVGVGAGGEFECPVGEDEFGECECGGVVLVEPVDGWCGDAVPVVGGGGDAGEVADESVYVVLKVWCEALEVAEFVECGEEDPVFGDVGCVCSS